MAPVFAVSPAAYHAHGAARIGAGQKGARMGVIEVIKGPQIAWSRDRQTGIEIGFRVCDEVTRRVRLDWELTSTSGDKLEGGSEELPLDSDSCVLSTAVVPPQELTAVFRLWDVARADRPLWEGTTYLSMAGFEPVLIPSPGQPLGPPEPGGGRPARGPAQPPHGWQPGDPGAPR